MTVEKPKPKQLLRPITTGAGSAMNQSQFLTITSNSLEAREKSRVHGAIGFGFASHWLKNWRESFKPITKHSNRNHVITFDNHLKTALLRKRPFQLVDLKLFSQYRSCEHFLSKLDMVSLKAELLRPPLTSNKVINSPFSLILYLPIYNVNIL